MKKIVIISDVSNLSNPIGGPSICMKLLQNEIKKQLSNTLDESNFEITSAYDHVYNSLVWHWCPIYKIELIDKLVKNNNIIICGPNSFFKGGDITHYEKYLIENKKYSYLFLHPKQYSLSAYFKQFINNTKIYDIVYPVDPKCYISSSNILRIYDLLIYKKFGCDDTFNSVMNIFSKYSINVVEYGNYKIDDLVNLASSSKCCIYLSCGETGGTACAEILCNGCPIISYFGNLTYGNDGVDCVKLPDNGTFICKPDIILKHYNTCLNMNNLFIASEARKKFDLTKIASETISLLKNIACENEINNSDDLNETESVEKMNEQMNEPINETENLNETINMHDLNKIIEKTINEIIEKTINKIINKTKHEE